ncbi:hypothetical protein HELRODRAFT_192399 [Helobdella robusta]|uniref:DUF4795 domain-containing protein n=1 Tax=Helobdella robusta TaxID=6412 RepID=T1FTW8_HELRO|nr:hypothetical protein HELRODRAFT_192399 [Helobdella robusta]ESO01188.1 hypothetical protein HELRODRAFT_192399 [Helobdella robusta]
MSSFQDLVDLSFGGPEDGQVNFNALHSLMHAIVYKLKLSDEKALVDNETIEKIKEHTKNFALLKTLKERQPSNRHSHYSNYTTTQLHNHHSIGLNSFVGLVERLKILELFWEKLNSLPTNEIIIKTTEANVPNLTPLTDMWDKIKVAKTVEACEQGIKKKEAIEELGNVANQFEKNESMMASITARMGEGSLPNDDFFDNLPTWTLLEQLMKGSYENIYSGKEKREMGEKPLSEDMKKMLGDLGAMVAYNDELLARIQTIENNLQYLTDRAATKADIQKLNVKMAEVQGIASAVDRLLCRIQGSEDQLCCLRQVINKIYGCVSNNTSQGSSQGVIACLGGKGEGAQISKNSTSNPSGSGGGGVNDNQLKLFMDQLTKVECELDAIKRNLVSVDGIKADVQNLFSIVNELDENKLDKCLLASVLAHKADKSQVEDKVSQSCFENTCTGLSSVINDILTKILENDAECRNIFNQLEKMVQLKSDREELEALKDQLEAKLKCMAKNFMGLQKFISEEGEGDDSMNFKRNVNQNQNDAPTPNTQASTPQSKAPPSLPLNPGLSGNKMIRQFPLMVKGTELKGANPTGSGPATQHRVYDSIPTLPDVKEFVAACQQNLSQTMNTLRACLSGTKLAAPCKVGFAEKSNAVSRDSNEFSTNVTAKLADKTVYSALLIGSDQKNQLTMDFEGKTAEPSKD